MTMLQITFLFIGFFILILVLATIFKRYQRTILWTAAICMFLGVLFSVGFGYVDVIREELLGGRALGRGLRVSKWK